LDEAEIGAGVAASAGGDQVGFVDGRTWIAGRAHVVSLVTIPATGRLHVSSQRAELRVEGIAVGGEFVFVAVAADGRGLHAEGRFGGLQNGVSRMAVAAD